MTAIKVNYYISNICIYRYRCRYRIYKAVSHRKCDIKYKIRYKNGQYDRKFSICYFIIT